MSISKLRNSLRESFGAKIFLSLSISILIVSSIFTCIVLFHEAEQISENLRNKGKTLAGLLAYSSKTAVFAENRAALDEAVKGIMTQENVLAVSVFTAEENALLGEWKGNGKTVKTKDAADREIITRLKAGSLFETVDLKDSMDCYSPVKLESADFGGDALYFDDADSQRTKSVIGYVRVTMDKTILKKTFRSTILKSVVLVSAFLFAGAVIVIILLRRVTRPLVQLADKVRRFGMGESVEKAAVESADEIGRLATAFNTMADNLEAREEDKKHLEEQLRNSQKMEAVGTLARGIAHDFNNILTTVQGSVYMLGKKLDMDSPLRHYNEQITNSLDKAKNLVQGLITFSRIQVINRCPVDVNDLISNLTPVLTGIVGEDVHLKISLPEGPLTILADPLQIEQVLMNLCSNARDAMPDGGDLAVNAEAVKIEASDSAKYNLTASGEYAVISVADSGIGMEEDIRERIFEPFFTTKEVGKGTGLGLAIVYGIIEQHKGHIFVNTQKGEGTMFEIFLPLMGINTWKAGDIVDSDSKERC